MSPIREARAARSVLDIRWRCREGVRLAPRADGGLELVVDDGPAVPLNLPCAAGRHVRQFNDGLSDAALAGGAGGDLQGIARLFRLKRRLQDHGLLVADLHWCERRLAIVRPRSPGLDIAATPADTAPARWRLSRFALLRRDGERLVLEATDAACDVVMETPELVRWIHETADCLAPTPEPARTAVLALLAALGFLDRADRDEPAAQRTWEFHDRLFHRRSRQHDDFRPMGATFRFRSTESAQPAEPVEPGDPARITCPPAIRPGHDGTVIDLPVPTATTSRPLTDVMESRRSRKEMGEPPVDLARVAALLYRVARVTTTLPGDQVLRPHPSSGGLHELEFHVAVRICQGLDPGFYHYRSEAHALTRLPGEDAAGAAAGMVTGCAASWGAPEGPPQCVIVVSSRLPRLAWKYSAIAYRLSLLNAGVVLQCLYLVATDLGLNGAAAGSGSAPHFARATGVSSWAETSILEFGFGSRPAGCGG